MANLIPPHGGKGLTCCLLEGAELKAEKKKAEGRLQPVDRFYEQSGLERCL